MPEISLCYALKRSALSEGRSSFSLPLQDAGNHRFHSFDSDSLPMARTARLGVDHPGGDRYLGITDKKLKDVLMNEIG